MALFDDVFTNIFYDGEVAGSSPDAEGDYYLVTDAQVDRNYMEAKLWDTLMAMSSAPSKIGAILFGGVVSDGGSGTINISEGVALAYDEAGNKRIVHIPALTGVALPSGWNNDRQIWVTAKYDFKLGSATRAHRAVGTTYHYQLNDTYMGDSSGYVSTGTADLFTDADPTATDVVLGSFKMNGTTYADQNVRNAGFFSGGGGMPTNTAIGTNTLGANTVGTNNTAIGSDSLGANTTGTNNTAIGINSLGANTIGINNTAIGFSSLGANTTGANNTAIGYSSLGANTTGSSNTAIGYSAGDSLTTGSNNMCLGYNSDASSATVSNEITLGNSSISALRCQVTSISSLSDMRDKTDIIPSSIGLNFINDLKPSVYKWDKREWYAEGIRDGSKKEDKLNLGFIAQDLDEIQKKYNAEFLNLVYFSNPEKLETTAGNLLPVMVKAIQDLSKKIDEQQIEIDSLKALQG